MLYIFVEWNFQAFNSIVLIVYVLIIFQSQFKIIVIVRFQLFRTFLYSKK